MSKIIMPSEDALVRFRAGMRSDGLGEGLKVKGAFKFELYDEAGELIDVRQRDNLVTTVGFQLIADCLGNTASRPATISYIGVGSGATAAAIGDTALQTQIVRVAATYSYAAKVITMAATLGAGTGTGAITEAGVFNASSAGTMLNHVVFSVINKGAADTMTVTFTFTMS